MKRERGRAKGKEKEPRWEKGAKGRMGDNSGEARGSREAKVREEKAKMGAETARAKAKMGGKHSARAMQLATKYYKDAGGTYSGKKKKTKHFYFCILKFSIW